MPYTVELLAPEQGDAWNRFVEESNEGTVFHRLDFLEYHGDRFREAEHHLVVRKGEEIFAVLPLAIFEEEGRRSARSPYGASLGGLCARKPLRYHEVHELLDALIAYLARQGVHELVLTPPIRPCLRTPSDTLRFALEQRGARLLRRLLCSVADLEAEGALEEALSSRARRAARKAERLGVRAELRADVSDFWKLMDLTYDRHGSPPTHSFEEWSWLCERLPDRFWVNVATLDGEPAAGIGCVRVNARVQTTFYLCNDPAHRDSQALTRLILETMAAARDDGVRWFDFGTTSRPEGFAFKENFGTRGHFRETLQLPMDDLVTDPWRKIVGARELQPDRKR